MLFGAGVDDFLGNAGWASFGLAGLVISWLLLKYLPDQEKRMERIVLAHATEIKALNEKHDAQVAAINEDWMNRTRDSQKAFEASLERIHLHNRELIDMIMKRVRKEHRLARGNEEDTGG